MCAIENKPSAVPPAIRFAPRVLLVIAIGAGAYYRFGHLGASPFWRDEASFAFMATASLGDLFQILQRDVHAPLYFLLLKGWVAAFGESEYALRSLGAIFGLLCVPAAYWFAAPVLGRVAAASVALFLALNPGQLLASTDLMVYPLLTLLTLLAMGTLERAWCDNRRSQWIAHTLLLTAMTYTHMWGLLLWTSAGAVALIQIIRHRRAESSWPPWLANYLVYNAIAVVLVAPWLARALGQAGSRTMDHLLYTPGFLGLLTATFDYWFNSRQVVLVVVILAVAIPLLWHRKDNESDPDRNRFNAAMLLALFLALGPQIISFEIAYWKASYLQRYTIPCIPFFLMLMTAALFRVRPVWFRIGLGAFIAVWPLVPLDRSFDGVRHAHRRRSPIREIAQRIEDQGRPGDVIFLFPEFYGTTFNWYYDGDLPQICYPTLERITTLDWHSYPDRIEDQSRIQPAVAHLLKKLAPGGRLWTIQNRAYQGTMGGHIDYKDTLARIMQALAPRLRYRPDLSHEYISLEPNSPDYAGLEGASLLVFEKPKSAIRADST